MMCSVLCLHVVKKKLVVLYRKVRSDGPPSAKLDRLYCPLFDFDTDKYGLQIPNQGLVNHLNAIFSNVKVKKGVIWAVQLGGRWSIGADFTVHVWISHCVCSNSRKTFKFTVNSVTKSIYPCTHRHQQHMLRKRQSEKTWLRGISSLVVNKKLFEGKSSSTHNTIMTIQTK